MMNIVIFDIDGVIRDVSRSYRRAIADTVESFTKSYYRPSIEDIDLLKAEGIWNNDWEASQELTYRYWESQGKTRREVLLDYQAIVTFFQARYRGKNWDVVNNVQEITPDLIVQLGRKCQSGLSD